MKSLDQFQGYREIFKEPRTLPPFFDTNLVDPARVVKIFENDPQASIRIFYYQYLKLCFELQNVNYDVYIRKVQDIINNPSFQFVFYPSDDPSIFNDNQAKSLIMEFFGVLGEGSQNALQSLTKYPVMDKVFVHFFRSLLILSNVTHSLDSFIDRDQLLDFLCKTFEVQAEIHGECIRYIETDIFIYELNPNAVYMAYMDYESYNHSLQKSAEVNLSVEQPKYAFVQEKTASLNSFNPQTIVQTKKIQPISRAQSKSSQNRVIKDSYIASEFVDFTSNVQMLTSQAKASRQSKIDQAAQPVKVQIKKSALEDVSNPVRIKETPKQVSVDVKQSSNPITFSTVNSNIDTSSIQPSQIKSQLNLDYWQQLPTINPSVQPKFAYDSQFTQPIQPVEAVSKYSPQVTQPIQKSPQLIKSSQPVKSPQQQLIPPKESLSIQTQQRYSNNSNIKVQNDIFYNPRNQTTKYGLDAFSSRKGEEEIKDIKSVTINKAANKKRPFGLNVSQEFTSQQISKIMTEPHSSNVETMKTRARNFRSSLGNYIK